MANKQALRSAFDDGTELDEAKIEQPSMTVLSPVPTGLGEVLPQDSENVPEGTMKVDMRKTGIYLPNSLFREAKKFCIDEDTSLSKLVTSLLRHHLERQRRKREKNNG